MFLDLLNRKISDLEEKLKQLEQSASGQPSGGGLSLQEIQDFQKKFSELDEKLTSMCLRVQVGVKLKTEEIERTLQRIQSEGMRSVKNEEGSVIVPAILKSKTEKLEVEMQNLRAEMQKRPQGTSLTSSKELQMFDERINALEVRYKKLLDEALLDYEEGNKKLQHRMDAVLEEIKTALATQLDDVAVEVERLDSESGAKAQEFLSALNHLSQQVEEMRASGKSSHGIAPEQSDAVQGEIQKLNESNKAIENALAQAEQNSKKQQREIETSLKVCEERLSGVLGEQEGVRGQLAELRKTLDLNAEKKEEMSAVRGHLEAFSKRADAFQLVAEQTQAVIDRLSQKEFLWDAALTRLEELVSENGRIYDRLKGVEGKVEALQTDPGIEALQRRVEELAAQSGETKIKMEILEKSYEKLAEKNKELESLPALLKTLAAEGADQNLENKKKMEMLESGIREISEQSKAFTGLSGDVENWAAEQRKVHSRLEAVETGLKKISENEKNVDDLIRRIDSLDAENRLTGTRLSAVENEQRSAVKPQGIPEELLERIVRLEKVADRSEVLKSMKPQMENIALDLKKEMQDQIEGLKSSLIKLEERRVSEAEENLFERKIQEALDWFSQEAKAFDVLIKKMSAENDKREAELKEDLEGIKEQMKRLQADLTPKDFQDRVSKIEVFQKELDAKVKSSAEEVWSGLTSMKSLAERVEQLRAEMRRIQQSSPEQIWDKRFEEEMGTKISEKLAAAAAEIRTKIENMTYPEPRADWKKLRRPIFAAVTAGLLLIGGTLFYIYWDTMRSSEKWVRNYLQEQITEEQVKQWAISGAARIPAAAVSEPSADLKGLDQPSQSDQMVKAVFAGFIIAGVLIFIMSRWSPAIENRLRNFWALKQKK